MTQDFEISHSSASNSRSCWKKYEFANVLKLKPKKVSRPISMGTTIHTAFDQLYQGIPKTQILSQMQAAFDVAIKMCHPEDLEDITIDKYTALGMFEFYPDNLATFKDIKPEVEFRVKAGRNLWLIGRADGLVNDGKLHWCRELKVTGLTMQQLQQRAQKSFQVSGYKYGLEKSLNLTIAGCMYDGIKKPLLRKRVNEDAEAFGKRIYADYKLSLTDQETRDKYYKRLFIFRSDEQMRIFLKDTREQASDIRRKMKRGKFNRNPDACWNYNRVCEYEPICWVEKPQQSMVQSLYDIKGQPAEDVEIEVNGLPF